MNAPTTPVLFYVIEPEDMATLKAVRTRLKSWGGVGSDSMAARIDTVIDQAKPIHSQPAPAVQQLDRRFRRS